MNISIATIKDYGKNNRQSTTNVVQNKANQSQFQRQKNAAGLMPADIIKEAVSKAEEMMVSNKGDCGIKTRTKILRSVIKDLASQFGAELKIRERLKNGGKQR